MRKPSNKKIRRDFLVFGRPLIGRPEISEVVACLKSGWLGKGPRVIEFEESFKKYKNCRFAIALNSCTAALHLSMLSLGIKRGDEVIVPTMAFTAIASAVIHAGGRPIFADCDAKTMNISPSEIEKRVTKRTKAITVLHFAGRPCDMNSIGSIAKRRNLKIIEDCAHSIEAEYRGRSAGTFGEIGCFSFYANKNICMGEGGMAVTGKKNYAEKIRILGCQGINEDAWKRFGSGRYRHYEVREAGFKYNMSDLQAAVGIHQLSDIDTLWERRRQIWDMYCEYLKGLPIFLPQPAEPNTRHAYHLYTVLLDVDRLRITRDQFLDEMLKRNVGVGVHYRALHLHPYYQNKFGYRRGDFPNAEFISDRTVSLPLSAALCKKDAENVVQAVKYILIKAYR